MISDKRLQEMTNHADAGFREMVEMAKELLEIRKQAAAICVTHLTVTADERVGMPYYGSFAPKLPARVEMHFELRDDVSKVEQALAAMMHGGHEAQHLQEAIGRLKAEIAELNRRVTPAAACNELARLNSENRVLKDDNAALERKLQYQIERREALIGRVADLRDLANKEV